MTVPQKPIPTLRRVGLNGPITQAAADAEPAEERLSFDKPLFSATIHCTLDGYPIALECCNFKDAASLKKLVARLRDIGAEPGRGA